MATQLFVSSSDICCVWALGMYFLCPQNRRMKTRNFCGAWKNRFSISFRVLDLLGYK